MNFNSSNPNKLVRHSQQGHATTAAARAIPNPFRSDTAHKNKTNRPEQVMLEGVNSQPEPLSEPRDHSIGVGGGGRTPMAGDRRAKKPFVRQTVHPSYVVVAEEKEVAIDACLSRRDP